LRGQGSGESEKKKGFHHRQPAKGTFRQDDSVKAIQSFRCRRLPDRSSSQFVTIGSRMKAAG
jgi:hypothetical protein